MSHHAKKIGAFFDEFPKDVLQEVHNTYHGNLGTKYNKGDLIMECLLPLKAIGVENYLNKLPAEMVKELARAVYGATGPQANNKSNALAHILGGGATMPVAPPAAPPKSMPFVPPAAPPKSMPAAPPAAPSMTAAAAAAAQKPIAPGDRVKVTSSINKLIKEFRACQANDIHCLDEGVRDTVGRTMHVVEVSKKGGFAKVAPAPNSDYDYEWTLVPLSCIVPAKPLPGAAAVSSGPPSTPLKQVSMNAAACGAPAACGPVKSPAKKHSSAKPQEVCWHHQQGFCKFGDGCKKLHLPPPVYPAALYPDSVMAPVRAAAEYVFERFYKKPYREMPDASYKGDPMAFFMDHDAKCGVERPNHGLANAIRKALLIPKIVEARGYDEALRNPELLIAMMVAMLFEVAGRESDIGFNDDPDTFLRYHANSVKAFVQYSQGFSWHSQRCVDALERMYMEPKNDKSKPVKQIFEDAHDLELFRCYPEEKMYPKVAQLCRALGTRPAMQLVLCAEKAIYKTGDRIYFSMTGLRERDYVPAFFTKCSLNAGVCIEAILGKPCAPTAGGALAVAGGPTAAPKPAFTPAPTPAFTPAPTPAPKPAAKPKKAIEARTLASSNFLELYAVAKVPKKFHKLMEHVDNVVSAHGKRCNISEEERDAYFEGMQKGAVSEGDGEMYSSDTISQVVVRMWTTAEQLGTREFCGMLNHFTREDDPAIMPDVVGVIRALNQHCVSRGVKSGIQWPADHKLYRGSALPRCHRNFYAVGKKYRVPMFLATSSQRERVAENLFMARLPPASASQQPSHQEPVLYILHLHPKKRCVNVNFIDKTDGSVGEEDEFLFPPYSTFTVRSATFVANPFGVRDINEYTGIAREKSYHIIELDVAPDNINESLELPLAPWA